LALLDVSKTSDAQKAEILKLAAEVRKFEIERFWGRSIFFWGFIAAAFVAYAQLYNKDAKAIAMMVACFGFVCSIAWTLVNRGGKYWQEAWEQKLTTVEAEVLGTPLFSNREPRKKTGWWGAAHYSVSRLTIALSDFTALTWLVLIAKVAPPLPFFGTCAWHDWLPVCGALVYSALLIAFGRASETK
jgi:hypothetical protein